MSRQLDQFIHEIGDIEKRIENYITTNKVPLDDLPSIPSIPSIPTINTFRNLVSQPLDSPAANNESDRLSSLLLSVKRDIQDFLLSGDLSKFHKYSKSEKSELEFIESTLRLVAKKYSVWTQVSDPANLNPTVVNSTHHIMSLDTIAPVATSSRRITRALKK